MTLNILFATPEAVPFCKTGGLGDVCGSLPRALADVGQQATVIMPAFRQALEAGYPLEDTGHTLEIPIGQKRVSGKLLRSHLPDSDVPVYLIEQADYFDRPQLYGENGEDYQDNCERFVFYCRAVLAAIELLQLPVDVLHCHDWSAALLPAYVKTEYGHRPPWDRIATLYTIHNLAYQGNFWHWDMALTGLDWKYFNWRQMEFYGNLNFMKTGIAFADAISTVSPTYAQEILEAPLSCGMEGTLGHRHADLFGILNGVDYQDWNPSTDPYLGENLYDVTSFEQGKRACKAQLQQLLGLPEDPQVPLLAMVGRLVDQKGIDLVTQVLQQWAPTQHAQWVILGTGDPQYHQQLAQLASDHPRKIAVRLEFSNQLAHQIEAGADMFLMPSQYEPCGLNQLYSLKYGTVPIVRLTGGLADTVIDWNPRNQGQATGFGFTQHTALALTETLQRALDTFAQPDVWKQLVRRGMQQDWSWARSAIQYVELYHETRLRARTEVLH